MANLSFNEEKDKYQSILEKLKEDEKNRNERSGLIIFPTVIHVVHYGSIGQISEDQVIDGLKIINDDFQSLNPDTALIDDVFKLLVGDIGFEFRLAQIDPNGNPTNGIVYLDTSIFPHPEPFDPNFDNVKFASHWPEDRYFNIWITRSIMDGVGGYAQYPGTEFTYGGPWHTWGPVIRANRWGGYDHTNNDGRTGTHEIGHCFGLYHTFMLQAGHTSCVGSCDTTNDEVCDTPPQNVHFYCDSLNSCSNDSLGPSPYNSDVMDMRNNFMGYASCTYMFSEGQKQRMLGFYNMFDTIFNLTETDNLMATGTLYPTGMKGNVDAKRNFTIYPNPVKCGSQIHVDIENLKRSFNVFNSIGKSISSGTISANGLINAPTNPGFYILHIYSSDGEMKSTRFNVIR